MGIIQAAGRVSSNMQVATAAGEFLAVARLLTKHRGQAGPARVEAEHGNYGERVSQILLKAPVSAGSLADPAWAAPLAPYGIASRAFSESLRQVSVFDRLLSDGMRRAPLRTAGFSVTTGIVGTAVSESTIKPIGRLTLSTELLEPRKAAAIVIVSDEIANFAAPAAIELFNNELKSAVAGATDQIFLSTLVAGTAPVPSAGSTLANIVTDLGVLLAAVNSNASSRLYYIIDPTNAKKLATKANSIGAPAFPAMGANGGEILPGVTALVSDQLLAGVVLRDCNKHSS